MNVTKYLLHRHNIERRIDGSFVSKKIKIKIIILRGIINVPEEPAVSVLLAGALG